MATSHQLFPADSEDPDLKAAVALSLADSQDEWEIPSDEKEADSVDPRDAFHLTAYHYPQTSDIQKNFFKVKIPGGGNCGFYAIALGLIHLIVEDKLTLTSKQYNEFIQLLKTKYPNGEEKNVKQEKAREDVNARLHFFKTGENAANLNPPRLKKCTPFIETILNKIDDGALDTLDQFKEYILTNLDLQVDKDYFLESMLIVLGPALREISVSVYDDLNNKKSDSSLYNPSPIQIQRDDGVTAPEEQLNLLASFFPFTFKAYIIKPGKLYYKSYSGSEAATEISHPLALVPPPKHHQEEKEEAKTPPTEVKSAAINSTFQERDHFQIETDSLCVLINPLAEHWDALFPQSELQRPGNLFLRLRHAMLPEVTSLEILTTLQYESSLEIASRGVAAFDCQSYYLYTEEKASETREWSLMYVNEAGEHQKVPIDRIKGLDKTIQALSKKNLSCLTPKETNPIKQAIARHTGHDKKFDEKDIPPSLKEMIKKSENNTKKLTQLMASIKDLEAEIIQITDNNMLSSGLRMTKLLKSSSIQLQDESISEEERLRLYNLLYKSLNDWNQCMPNMSASLCKKVLTVISYVLYFLINIPTCGMVHCAYSRFFKKPQPVENRELPQKLTKVKKNFNALTESLKEKAGSTNAEERLAPSR